MNALATITQKMAARFDIESDNPKELIDILKQTAFKQRDGVAVSDAQLSALMIIAQQYGLNPFVREIYAYPDKGGIVPVVGVDGWTRIGNDHPQFEGMEFRYSEEILKHKGKLAFEWIECVVYRKDRSKPVVAREYFDEVCRSVNFTTPWDSHPKRMHRHKAMIQAFRMAFGFSGIQDEDDAIRIAEKEINPLYPSSDAGVPIDIRISACETISELEKLKPVISKLSGGEKATALSAYSAKKRHIESESPTIEHEQPAATDIAEVLAEIARMEDKPSRDAAIESVQKLSGADKDTAAAAYKAKIADLKKKSTQTKPDYSDWIAAIEGSSSIDELESHISAMPEEAYNELLPHINKKQAQLNDGGKDPFEVE